MDKPILTAPEAAETPEAAAEAKTPARDYAAEVAALLTAKPDLVGKSLPDDVMRAAVEQGVPLLQAYLDHEQAETAAELRRLREENRVYRQNAEAARRSPVQGVSGAPGDEREGDPFLAGFNGESW